jgi:hypothetical protein
MNYRAEELAKSYERGLEGKSSPQGLLDSIHTAFENSDIKAEREDAFVRGAQDAKLVAALKK